MKPVISRLFGELSGRPRKKRKAYYRRQGARRRPAQGGVPARARAVPPLAAGVAFRERRIARLIDAGHRADGHPCLAMEYVEGRPIDGRPSTSAASWRSPAREGTIP